MMGIKQRKVLILKSMIDNNLEDYFESFTNNLEYTLPNGFNVKGREILRDNFPCFDEIVSHGFINEEYHFFENRIIENGQYYAKFGNGRELVNYEKNYVYFWIKEGKTWKITKDITVWERAR